MCDNSKLTPEYVEWLKSRPTNTISVPCNGFEFKAGEDVVNHKKKSNSKAPGSTLTMELIEGVCDGCGATVKHQRAGLANYPALYKFAVADGRYLQVCWECFRAMSSSASFAYGE